MITIEKLKEYEEYRGYYDGFYIQKVKNNTNITSDEEWHLLDELLQDLKLSKKGLVSKEFSERLEQRLVDTLDSQESIDYIQKLVNEEW